MIAYIISKVICIAFADVFAVLAGLWMWANPYMEEMTRLVYFGISIVFACILTMVMIFASIDEYKNYFKD